MYRSSKNCWKRANNKTDCTSCLLKDKKYTSWPSCLSSLLQYRQLRWSSLAWKQKQASFGLIWINLIRLRLSAGHWQKILWSQPNQKGNYESCRNILLKGQIVHIGAATIYAQGCSVPKIHIYTVKVRSQHCSASTGSMYTFLQTLLRLGIDTSWTRIPHGKGAE